MAKSSPMPAKPFRHRGAKQQLKIKNQADSRRSVKDCDIQVVKKGRKAVGAVSFGLVDCHYEVDSADRRATHN